MKALVLAIALVLVACKKEEVGHYVSYRATCRMCAVEWRDDGATYRDTIIGQVIGEDTIPANGKWNIMAADGDPLFIRACPLRQDSADGLITVRITSQTSQDVIGGMANTAPLFQCSAIDQSFHQ